MRLPNLTIYSSAISDGILSDSVRISVSAARQLEDRGDYSGARDALAAVWRGVGHEPNLEGLNEYVKREALLRIGSLTARLASSSQILGANETAKNILTDCLIFFDEQGDGRHAMEACYGLALCCWNHGAMDDARAWLHDALSRQVDDVELKVRARLLLTIVEAESEHYQRALAIHREIADLTTTVENHYLLGVAHNEHAIILKKVGVADGRIDYLNQALIEYAGAGFHFQLAGHARYESAVENNTGSLLLALNRSADALIHTTNAVAQARALKDKAREAEYLETHARVLIALRRYDEAEKVIRKSVELLRFGGQHGLLAESLATQGITLARLRRNEEARRAFNEAEAVALHVEDKERAERAVRASLKELGNDFEEAEPRLTEGRSLPSLSSTWEGFSLKNYLSQVEETLIVQAFQDADGRHGKAAALLGVSAACLNVKLKKYPKARECQLNRRLRSLIKPPMPSQSQETDVCLMADDSLSDKGPRAGDYLVFKTIRTPADGSVVVVRSRGKNFIGIYRKTAEGFDLLPTDPTFQTWCFGKKEADEVEAVGAVLGYVKKEEADAPKPPVYEL